MAIRPVDLQVILQVSRNVEKMQMLQQQHSQKQQEQLALYMQKNFQVRQHQTEAMPQSEQGRMRPVSDEEKQNRREKEKKDKEKKKGKKKLGSTIDIFV